jgi:hypothetical protein
MTPRYVLLAAGPDVVGLRAGIESWMRGSGAVAATNIRVLRRLRGHGLPAHGVQLSHG